MVWVSDEKKSSKWLALKGEEVHQVCVSGLPGPDLHDTTGIFESRLSDDPVSVAEPKFFLKAGSNMRIILSAWKVFYFSYDFKKIIRTKRFVALMNISEIYTIYNIYM